MLIAIALSVCAGLAPARADSLWDTYGEYATRLDPLDPTPMGDGHLGTIKSGNSVQLRFPVPKGKVLGYWLLLGNIVAYTGKGTSYQLILRRDAKDGPVIYQGPVIASGDQFNASTAESQDITGCLTAADGEHGTLDVWATTLVEGDDWTIYRHDPQARRIASLVAVASPELEAKIAAAKALADLGIAVVPMPQEIKVEQAHLRLSESPRIWLGPGTTDEDAFAAQDLAEQIAEKTPARPVVVREKPTNGHITFRAARPGELGKPGLPGQYLLRIPPDGGVEIVAADAAGRFYGAQTLTQLILDDKTNTRPGLTAMTIRDWPAFPVRSFQYDIARGQTVNVEFCKSVIRDLARLKLNNIMFYLEDDFRFDKYPFTGRPDTFTPQKARELSAYARRCHMTLTPQFEALGHASAVLSHPELADLREAGSSWVFCTSEPRTWEFLRDVFTELAAAFPDSPYLHVGADEFEGGFGLCDRCQAKSPGALYVEHMTKLNDICRSLGRKMLFWPSHGGPTPDLSFMALRNAAAMPHDSIPTEWIYHGPPAYPEIAQYQDAGFEDVWVCPAVVDWFMVYPDYPTTFRAIRGFYRVGAERKVGGACTTTWGLQYGALFGNSWLGLCYAAECGWSLGATPVADFERRWAASWLGAREDDSAQLVAETLAEPVPAAGEVARFRDYTMVSNLVLKPLRETHRQFALKQPALVAAAPQLVTAADSAVDRLNRLRAESTRDTETLDFALIAFRMMRLAGAKLRALDVASAQYAQAVNDLAASPDKAAAALGGAADALAGLAPDYEWLGRRLKYAVDHCGAWDGDRGAIESQATELADTVTKLRSLADDLAAGRAKALPPAGDLGLERGVYTRVAGWTPAECREQGFEIRADLTGKLPAGAQAIVEFEYTGGAHALRISRVALLTNGVEASSNQHAGLTGAANQGNRYELTVPADLAPATKLEIAASVASWGGNDSAGTVWLVTDAP